MASIYWRNGTAWAKAQRYGKVVRRSLKTEDATIAETRLAVFVRELDGAGCSLGDYTVREAIDKFTVEHMPHLKKGAIRRYMASASWILEHFADVRLRDIGRKELYGFEQWRRAMRHRGKQIAPATIKRDLAYLSSVISEAEVWEWCQYNPVKPYLRGRAQKGVLVEGPPRERYLDHDEEPALLRAVELAITHPTARAMMGDAIAFAIDTGLRAEEQWSLTRADFNFARRRVRVRAETAKSSKSRWVPLLPRAFEIAERLRVNNRSDFMFWRYDGERVEHTWAFRLFQKVVAAAGLTEHLEWHDLRRTCGCRLLQDHDMPIDKVSHWLGHSGVVVTRRHYAFLRVEDLERAIKGGDRAAM